VPINVIHPDGESSETPPRIDAAILGNSYFLDRFVAAVTSVFAAVGLSFGVLHLLGLRSEVLQRRVAGIVHYWREDLGRTVTEADIQALEAKLLDQQYAFDPFAPVYEQFAQFAWSVLTWAPIAGTLLGCGVLAVAAQRYAY
jgi:hypothetical protein